MWTDNDKSAEKAGAFLRGIGERNPQQVAGEQGSGIGYLLNKAKLALNIAQDI
jgi:hypothetical protein